MTKQTYTREEVVEVLEGINEDLTESYDPDNWEILTRAAEKLNINLEEYE